MITCSIIKKSQVEGDSRLDAEYFQPEYLDIEKRINSIQTVTIEEISESVVNFGAYSLCNYISWEEKGVSYLNVENIKDGYIDFENVKHINDEVNEILKKSKVKEGQVIITMAGTIGNTAVAHRLPTKVNSNQATAKITLKKGYSPYYLSAFLNSYYGRKQTEREIVSSVQPNIFLWQIKNFKVPIALEGKERQIEQIYKEGLNALEQSIILYSQAEDLLLEELGLKDYEKTEDLSCVVNFSDLNNANRMDAEYFQPKYGKLISKLKINDTKPLHEIIDDVKAKFNPYKQPENIFRYVELSDINSSIGVIDSSSEIVGRDAPSRAKRILKAGDVIASSVEGSLKKVALVNKEQEGYLASTGFFQFRSNDIMPEIILVLAKSLIFQMQLEKQCAGTILTAVPKESIKNLSVPIIPKSIQQKIADLVKQSHDARKKAKELLELAKKEVEDIILKKN